MYRYLDERALKEIDTLIGRNEKKAAALSVMAAAMGRLQTFALLHHSGGVIDETSGLTRDDLNVLLGVLEEVRAIASRKPTD